MRVYLASYHMTGYQNPDLEPKYTLESFFFIYTKGLKLTRKLNDETFLLDSGAFSFTNAYKGKKVDFESYLNAYIDYINKNDIKLFFELDIDEAVGLKEVERLRSELERRTGKKSIPVWNTTRGIKYFEKLCKEYNYVALGRLRTYRSNIKLLKTLIDIAHKNNCKIHGLGFTSTDKLHYLHFDSVDSSSYSSGSRFGHLFKFSGTRINQLKVPENKRMTNYVKVNRHNTIEWMKFQEYADKFL